MRKKCYQILKDFETNQTYLNLALKGLDGDKYPVGQIAIRVYGIVQNNELLDYLVDELCERKKVDKNVRLILKMQIFEYRFLEKEIHICVSEGVNLAKVYCKSASGFINANLRNLEQIKDKMPTFANEEKNISIKYSHPRFIVKALASQYPEDYQMILESNTKVKDTFVRIVNQLIKADDFELFATYEDIAIYRGKSIVNHPDFLAGNIIIQDLGSYLVGKLVNANSDEVVLDLCAAPGNKTMHISETAKIVVANELHPHRAELIRENIAKHNISNIEVINNDAADYEALESDLASKNLPLKYDKILIDAPCSGWGVIKSKPEIKYNHTKADIAAIGQVSKQIVEASLNLLADGGQLIFSTCTLNRDENDYLINQVCEQYGLHEVRDEQLNQLTKNDSKLGILLKNYHYNSDSFYMVKLEKKMINIYNLDKDELSSHLAAAGIAKFRAKQIWNWLYIKLVTDFTEMKNIDAKTREYLTATFFIPSLESVKHQVATDGTQKALLRLSDGKLIETVLMKYNHGYSVCVTTQIGCAVGCSFCASGLQGFTRNLLAGEIVAQIIYWQRELSKSEERVSNVVVMGIGEPFNNYKNTIRFIDVINDHDGINIGARHITVSTSGIVPKIYELAQYDKQVNLAISLHAANDRKRSKIMKINDAYDISELMEAVDSYIETTNRRVSFEYIMLKNVNDSEQDARELANLVYGKNCHINLIPYNSVDENDYRATLPETTNKFVNVLKGRNIQVSVRRSNGEDIDGACGQLRHKEKENNAQI